MIDDEMKYPHIVQDNPKMIISRRDYFAGLAMQIFIANQGPPINTHEMSDFCVNIADALIKRLDEAKDV